MRGLLVVCCLSGCVYFVGDDDGDDVCVLREATPHLEPAPLRNPDTLTCESFGGGCDPACGPCPAAIPPIPSWGVCGSSCESLAQSACEADPGCRVVLDAHCAIGLDCLTDYIGCFPVDTATDDTIDCFAADAWSCSRSNNCTALHTYQACPTDADCARPFGLCVREGTYPGRCWEQVTCRALPPDCPSGKTPGIQNGCYTGACIPLDLCEPT